MIGIHTASGSFVAEWIAYLQEKGIEYKEIDCFSTSIMQQVKSCSAILWHWEHHDIEAQLFARQLICSVEEMGIKVFPGLKTSWHYDDKVGQKYLLEACDAPLIPTYVFYKRETALQWIKNTSFPKVWKLRGGAGSQNVRLINTAREGRKTITKAFSRGFRNSKVYSLQNRIWEFRRDKTIASLFNIAKGVARVLVPHRKNARSPIQQNYIYFQDFIPGNDCDIRVVAIGDRAFAIKRLVRAGDFRASGSGSLIYDPAEIPMKCIETAFQVSKTLNMQCCAFDFVFDGINWLIVEISYAFTAEAYRKCPGYWDGNLIWHEESVNPERFIVDDLLITLSSGCYNND